MKAFKTIFAGGAALAALVSATPASAQYYPGTGGYGGTDIIGQIIGSMIGGGYGSPYGGYGTSYGSPYASPYGYGGNGGYGGYGGSYGNGSYASSNQYAVGLCMGAVQQRLDSSFGRSQYGGARVLGVSDVQGRSNGGTLVSGVANSGRAGAYGYQGGQPPVDLTFTCKTDRAGMVSSIEVGQATVSVDPRVTMPGASPYANDYSAYGYRRY